MRHILCVTLLSLGPDLPQVAMRLLGFLFVAARGAGERGGDEDEDGSKPTGCKGRATWRPRRRTPGPWVKGSGDGKGVRRGVGERDWDGEEAAGGWRVGRSLRMCVPEGYATSSRCKDDATCKRPKQAQSALPTEKLM